MALLYGVSHGSSPLPEFSNLILFKSGFAAIGITTLSASYCQDGFLSNHMLSYWKPIKGDCPDTEVSYESNEVVNLCNKLIPQFVRLDIYGVPKFIALASRQIVSRVNPHQALVREMPRGIKKI